MKRFLAICFTILLLTPVVNSSNMVRKIGNLNQINCQIKSDEFNEKEWTLMFYCGGDTKGVDLSLIHI